MTASLGQAFAWLADAEAIDELVEVTTHVFSDTESVTASSTPT
jgi:hypothetical protein